MLGTRTPECLAALCFLIAGTGVPAYAIAWTDEHWLPNRATEQAARNEPASRSLVVQVAEVERRVFYVVEKERREICELIRGHLDNGAIERITKARIDDDANASIMSPSDRGTLLANALFDEAEAAGLPVSWSSRDIDGDGVEDPVVYFASPRGAIAAVAIAKGRSDGPATEWLVRPPQFESGEVITPIDASIHWIGLAGEGLVLELSRAGSATVSRASAGRLTLWCEIKPRFHDIPDADLRNCKRSPCTGAFKAFASGRYGDKAFDSVIANDSYDGVRVAIAMKRQAAPGFDLHIDQMLAGPFENDGVVRVLVRSNFSTWLTGVPTPCTALDICERHGTSDWSCDATSEKYRSLATEACRRPDVESGSLSLPLVHTGVVYFATTSEVSSGAAGDRVSDVRISVFAVTGVRDVGSVRLTHRRLESAIVYP